MPKLQVPLPDGPIEITYHDGDIVREHTWHVKDGNVHVAEADIEFFTKHVTGAQVVTEDTEETTEETPPARKKA